jgi:hypothetical protein
MSDFSVSAPQQEGCREVKLAFVPKSGDKLFSSLMHRLELELDVLVERIELQTLEPQRAAPRPPSIVQGSCALAAPNATRESPGGTPEAESPQPSPVRMFSSSAGTPNERTIIYLAAGVGPADAAGSAQRARGAPGPLAVATVHGSAPSNPLAANTFSSFSSEVGADAAEVSHRLTHVRRVEAPPIRSAARADLSVVVSAGGGSHDVEVAVRLRNAGGDERERLREGLRQEMGRLGLARYRMIVDGVDIFPKGGADGN